MLYDRITIKDYENSCEFFLKNNLSNPPPPSLPHIPLKTYVLAPPN
jgi:hypothetical protein